MEPFPDGAHVRLRNRARRAYLHADEDGWGVSLNPRRASLNAAWRVHRVVRDDVPFVLFHGAAYGRYLAASDEPAPSGHLGQRVVQGVYDDLEATAVVWTAVDAEDRDDVLLRHVSSGRLLRANGRYRTWNTGATVDNHDSRSTMTHWVVEPLQPRATPPALPPPPQLRNVNSTAHLYGGAGTMGAMFVQPVNSGGYYLSQDHRRTVPLPERTIRYVRAGYFGNFNDHGWATFQFQGRSVFILRLDVARHVGQELYFFNFTLCTRAGRYGRLTPLTIDLPRSQEPMDIIAFIVQSPGAHELQYPNVDAP